MASYLRWLSSIVALTVPVVAQSTSLSTNGSTGSCSLSGGLGSSITVPANGFLRGNCLIQDGNLIASGPVQPDYYIPFGETKIAGGGMVLNSTGSIEIKTNGTSSARVSMSGGLTLSGGMISVQPTASPTAFELGKQVPIASFNKTTSNLASVGSDQPWLKMTRSGDTYSVLSIAGAEIGKISTFSANGLSMVPTLATGPNATLSLIPLAKDQLKFEINLFKLEGKPVSLGAAATFKTANGAAVPLDAAAALLGYDHFNYIQYITYDTRRTDGKAGNRDYSGNYPVLPVADPAPGGWEYMRQGQGSGPVADFWPSYYDEYFGLVEGSQFTFESPNRPMYFNQYRKAGGSSPVSPGDAEEFVFTDAPSAAANAEIRFETALVGVRGTGCASKASNGTNCFFDLVKGWRWTAKSGVSTPGDALFDPADGPRSGDIFSPEALAAADLTAEQFLAAAGMSIAQWQAMGNGLSDVNSILVSVAVPEPSQVMLLLGGGCLLLWRDRKRADRRKLPLRRSQR